MATSEAKTEKKKEAMLKALEKALGVVTTAAQNAGLDPSTHYDWIKPSSPRYDEVYAQAVEMIENMAIDFAETALFQKISGVKKVIETSAGEKDIVYKKEPDTTAIIFYLKTKGKKRGYSEKLEIEDQTKREPLEIIVRRNAETRSNE